MLSLAFHRNAMLTWGRENCFTYCCGFLPDLDTFYREWLGSPLPDTAEYVDKTLDVIDEWSS